MGMYDKYDDSVSVQNARRDFPTCRVFAICDGYFEKTTFAEDKPFVQSHWTVIHVVDEGDGGVETGGQHTIAHFPSKKAKFFERETKKAAGRILGLTSNKAIDKLTGKEVQAVLHGNKKVEASAPGVVLEIQAKHFDATEEKGAFTRIEYLRRVPADEIKEVLGKKGLKLYFPNGMDEEGRAIGHALHEEEPRDDDEKPRKKKGKVSRDEDEDEEPVKKGKIKKNVKVKRK